MRFISLDLQDNSNPYYTIMKYGCGPKYVLNRSLLFEQMIAEQGLVFWFRFWLSFCLNPQCYHLKSIEEQLPGMITSAHKHLHMHLLDGTTDEKCQYCLNVIRSMTKHQSKKLLNSTDEIFCPATCLVKLKLLIINLTEIAFGAALCEIFYKWLTAEKMGDQNTIYWTIPNDYLNENFKARSLERFLVKWWRQELVTFLGVSGSRVGWIRQIMDKTGDQSVIQLTDRNEWPTHLKFIQEITRVVIKRKEERIKIIDEFDEQLKKVKSCVGKLITDKPRGKERKRMGLFISSNEYEMLNSTIDKHEFNVCANCNSTEGNQVKFITCKRCENENWSQCRYYCCTNCRIEHWFKIHHKEHYEYKKDKGKNAALQIGNVVRNYW